MRATMSATRPLPAWRRWAAACALVALFGVALAPSISRWLQAGAPDALAALCGGGPASHDTGNVADDDAACALCVLAHAAPPPGTPVAPALARFDGGHVLVATLPASRQAGTPPWRALARAPPRTA
jgi:hypothetical protein